MHPTTKLYGISIKGNIQVANMEGDITAMVNIVFIDKHSGVSWSYSIKKLTGGNLDVSDSSNYTV